MPTRIETMPRVLVLVPTASYRTADFVAAARALGVELVVGIDEKPAIAGSMVQIPLHDPDAAAAAIDALDRERGIDAVIAVDDQGIVAAAAAGARLGFPHSPVAAVAATRDKAEMRRRLAAGEVSQPRWSTLGDGHDDGDGDAAAVGAVGFPCVVKPTGLSGSRGVIRCDTPAELAAARNRIRAFWDGPLLLEEYVPGVEVAVEALLHDDECDILAVFDKPDPLVGPYFEETIYVTPSRLADDDLAACVGAAERAARALGLTEGPVHAEIRVDGGRARVVEVAARSIGGLCARTLRFGAGISLEEVMLRHALAQPVDQVARERDASGVMMLPIPRSGTLRAVHGQERARAVPGVVGLDITIPVGRPVVPLPEGDRYLGFLFARGPDPATVEAALRAGAAALDIVIT
jgi:biotin carboxylase